MNDEKNIENEIQETSNEVSQGVESVDTIDDDIKISNSDVEVENSDSEDDSTDTSELDDDSIDTSELDDESTDISNLEDYGIDTSELENDGVETSDSGDGVETLDFEDESVEISGESVDSLGPAPYHERYYLKYREGKRSTALDIEGTINFLQQIGFDGGELKQARNGKNQAELLRNKNMEGKNQMHCSYCRTEISGVEYARLPDGRLRCNNCSNTVVKNKAEVEALCKRVIANMDSFFGAAIDVSVSIEVVEERKLKKKMGMSLGTNDSQSVLVLGGAINKNKKYSIVLENGAPRISLIATFAHELTHIWQYINWDDNKKIKNCPKNQHVIIYEGMAKWVEIQYLYLVGEINAATREENYTRKRQDEYGAGFRLYEQHYPLTREAMLCDETPFTKDGYPL